MERDDNIVDKEAINRALVKSMLEEKAESLGIVWQDPDDYIDIDKPEGLK